MPWLGLVLVIQVLHAAPALSLANDSPCAPREVLAQELKLAGLVFTQDGELRLSLSKEGRLTLRREGKLVLSRELGSGSCDELGRAAGVVVARYVRELHPFQTESRTLSSDAATVNTARVPVKKKVSGSDVLEAATEISATPNTAPSKAPAPLDTPSMAEPSSPPLTSADTSGIFELPDASTPNSGSVKVPRAPSLPPLRAENRFRETQAVVTFAEAIDGGPTSPPSAISVIAPDGGPAPEPVIEPSPIHVSHFELLAGAGVAIPDVPEIGPQIAVDFAVVLSDRLRLNLAGLFDFGGSIAIRDTQENERGILGMQGGLVIPGAAYCISKGLRFCIGIVAGTRIVVGESSGPFVFQTSSKTAVAFVGGPAAQAAFFAGPFHLALDVGGLFTPLPPTFGLEGLPGVLAVPVAQAHIRLSIGFGFSR